MTHTADIHGDVRSLSAAHDARLLRRLDTIVPVLMERERIDAWVLSAREYAEDAVLATMLPSTWLETARRRTILVFTDRGRSRVAIGRYPVGEAFPSKWDPAEQPDQWRALADHLARANAATIAVNTSHTFALADGLTASEDHALRNVLPADLADRLVSGEGLAIGWLETRLPEEVPAFQAACSSAHGILRRALSREVIDPDVTTTKDVEWWLRQTVHDAGLGSWFHPSASVQRSTGDQGPIAGRLVADEVIARGDLVHIDFGIVAAGLHTDQQQHAYVLRQGESSAPPGLSHGLKLANRLQDILMEQMRVGRRGNEVLRSTLDAARAEGLRPTIYTHPIGLHGHAAGATIGLWDQQDGVPGQGDYPIQANTAWSIELSVEVDVPEWDDRTVRIMVEEDAFHDGDRITFLDGRQTELWLI